MLQVRSARLYYARLFFWLLPLLAGGCWRQRAETTVDPALPLADSLPTAWTALRDVEAVNIDSDPLTEYLLFFTYNNTTTPGPVGAVIYDSQANYTPDLAGNSSDQPSSALVPYALLPSYRSGAGQGFVAEPAQREAVTFFPINFRTRTTAATDSETGEIAQADALVIRGGNNYLTFVWWQNPDVGYGITQLYAPGGFESAPQQPFNWAGWEDAPQPLKELIAVQPLHDRNLLCRRIRHQLVAPSAAELAQADQPINAITYLAQDLGLQFCDGVPAAPFYPEGVVLAYLLTGRSDLLDLAGPNAQTPEAFAQLIDREALVRVEDLAAYRTLTPNPTLGGEGRITTACAEIMMRIANGGESLVSRETITDALPASAGTSTDASPPVERRWLLFTLRHQPPQLNPPTADQLLIINVNPLPAPQDGVALNCHQQLGG